MALRRIPSTEGSAALARFIEDRSSLLGDPEQVALAVRFGLQLLRDKAPGRSVEVRVPPFGAAQVVEGPRHSRGTPPAVIEFSAEVWLELVTGQSEFQDVIEQGRGSASGLRADLQDFLPLWPLS